MTNSVSIKNVHKFYNKGKQNQLHVMNGITLELPESGMVAVFGRSGCGKTTLLNAIGGLDKTESGEILLFGESIRKNTDDVRNKYIGYIFQNYNLNVKETVYENVAAALRISGMTDEDAIFERTVAALSNVEMDNYKLRTPDTLSGGQQQRVAIARALVKNPKIILADEPTGNLDEANTVMVMDILKEISKTQLVILVTHEESLVDLYCDRVIELSDGRVVSERENESTSGYRQRGKNDIYLGEKEKHTVSSNGVCIELYGEPSSEIKLKIISHEGKLYLKSDTESLRLLDNTSEIKLHEGEFHEKISQSHSASIDMSRLPPIEVTKGGRLYSFKSSVMSSLRDNLGIKKKGQKLLRVAMFMLSVVLVFITASAGVPIRTLSEVRENLNPNVFYIPIDPLRDYSAVAEGMDKEGIDYAKLIEHSYLSDTETIRFRVGNFITAPSIRIKASAKVVDVKLMKDKKLLAGSSEIKQYGDVLITSALADDIIESSTYGYIDSYDDLIGIVSNERFSNIQYVRIAGVVESNDKYFGFDSLSAAWFALYSSGASHSFMSKSLDGYKGEIEEGSVVYVYSPNLGEAKYKQGDKLTVFGNSFTVSRLEYLYNSPDLFTEWVYNVKGEKFLSSDEYFENKRLENTKSDPTFEYYEWLFTYLLPLVGEYYNVMLDIRGVNNPGSTEYSDWALSNGLIPEFLSIYSERGADIDYAAYLYRLENGRSPYDSELSSYISSISPNTLFKKALSDSEKQNYDKYIAYVNSFVYTNGFDNKSESYFVLSDKDYIRLSYSAGKSDSTLDVARFIHEDFGDGYEWYSNHLMVHASDPEKAEAYLREHFGDELITPSDVFNETIESSRLEIIASAVTIAVVLLLMCLCTFFIMRANFMPKVKEVGIMRAIGVRKRNIAFRFMLEGATLTTLTLLPGYIISTVFIKALENAPLFGSAFYFPMWLVFALIAVVYTASVLFGVLPSVSLLRRTPSEILAKYDI